MKVNYLAGSKPNGTGIEFFSSFSSWQYENLQIDLNVSEESDWGAVKQSYRTNWSFRVNFPEAMLSLTEQLYNLHMTGCYSEQSCSL